MRYGKLLVLSVFMMLIFSSSVFASVDGNFEFDVVDECAVVTLYTGTEKDVIIPETLNGYSVTSIESGAFSNNKFIESVTGMSIIETKSVFQSYNYIPPFVHCNNLKKLIFPKLEKINNRITDYCPIQEISVLGINPDVNWPEFRGGISYDTIINCTIGGPLWEACRPSIHTRPYGVYGEEKIEGSFSYRVCNNSEIIITGYTGSDKSIAIPSEIEGKTVTAIDDNVFIHYNPTKSINNYNNEYTVTANTVKYVGKSSFAYSSLKDMAFNELEYANIQAFYGVRIEELYLPKAKCIAGAFVNCSSLKKVVLPEVEYIDSFTACFALESLYCPKAKVIKNLNNCIALTDLYIPKVEEIYNSFNGNIPIEEIVLPNVSYLGGWSFDNNKTTKRVVLMRDDVTFADDFLCLPPINFILNKDLQKSDTNSNTFLKQNQEEWVSHNSNIVTVNNGYIKAVNIGSTTVENIKQTNSRVAFSVENYIKDVPDNAWYHDAVYDLVNQGIVVGKGKGIFDPQGSVTRGEFVSILARASGDNLKQYNYTSSFADSVGHWSNMNINWAKANGVVNGTSATTFDPNDNITREQLAVMISNYAKYKGIALPQKRPHNAFADEASISGWARDCVRKMYQAIVISGKGNNRFDPQGNATRAEASVMFSNYLHL